MLDVQEGTKLAGKVDALRQLSASEQASIALARDASVTEAKRQVGVVLAELAAAKELLATVTSQTNALRQQENGRSKELDGREATLNERYLAIDKIAIDAGIARQEADAILLQAKDTNDRANEDREVARALRADIVSDSKKAAALLREAAARETSSISSAAAREDELARKEADVAVRERDVLLKLDHVANEWKRLGEKERAIIDAGGVLARNLERAAQKK